MGYTQASTSPATIFLPPDPPESAPPGAGPPDRGSPFAGMLEGHTNARTAPAEGVKKKGPPAITAAPAEGSPAPKSEGAHDESAKGAGQAGTAVAGSGAEAAAQSEPTSTPIGGEASVAAGAAVAVGAATAAPLTLAEPGASAPGAATAPTPGAATVPSAPQEALKGEAIVPTAEAAPTDPTATPLPATEPTSSATPAPTATAAGAGQIELPASAEAVTGEEVAPVVKSPVPRVRSEAPEPQVGTPLTVESKVELEAKSGASEGKGRSTGDPSSPDRPAVPTPPQSTPVSNELTSTTEASDPTVETSHEAPPQTTTTQPTTVPTTPATAPAQAPANSPTSNASFASPAGPAPSPAAALEATIRMAGENGYTRARVTLHPAELGGVEVLLRGGASGLTATVVAENPHAAHLLQQSAVELQRRLADQGIELASIQILAGGGEAPDSAPNGREGASAPAGRAATGNADDTDAPAAPEQIKTIDLGGGVLVDVLA
jgi:flagellar hook-length control protein FliK